MDDGNSNKKPMKIRENQAKPFMILDFYNKPTKKKCKETEEMK